MGVDPVGVDTVTDLVIRSGSAVDVDTASLRGVIGEMNGVIAELDDLETSTRLAVDLLGASAPETAGVTLDLAALRATIGSAADEGRDVCRRLEAAADLYEAVELLMERAAAQARGEVDAVSRLDQRLVRIAADDPETMDAAHRAFEADPDHSDLRRQAFWATQALPVAGMAFPFLAPWLLGSIDRLGAGRVSGAARLRGHAQPVQVRAVHAAVDGAPPSLAAAAARMPTGSDAQVRVERYAMGDGSRRFAVYVAGTRSGGSGSEEPFDLQSNMQLYGGERSSSYDATLAALEQAGAEPGDAVHAFGHSQGAMVAERMAVEGPYDVQTLVSFGSPVQADVPDSTMSVTVRHTDDPIAALQAGGHHAAVGSEDSFVVEREADPMPSAGDITAPAHGMAEYIRTAEMVDAETDPRVNKLREALATLGSADSVDAQEYVARREVSHPGSDEG